MCFLRVRRQLSPVQQPRNAPLPLCCCSQGRVFAWIDRMLAAQPSAARLADWGPPKAVVARSALTNLLQVGAASIKLCSIVLCLLMLAYIEQRCWKAADLHQLACVDSTLVAGSCSHALMCWVPGPLQSTDDRSLHSINDRANHVILCRAMATWPLSLSTAPTPLTAMWLPATSRQGGCSLLECYAALTCLFTLFTACVSKLPLALVLATSAGS